MNFDFGDVLSRTWKIGWNHKVLWVFQMLPILFSVVMFPFVFLANPAFAFFLPEPWNQFASEPWLPMLFLILVFIMIIPILFVSVVAQTATTLGALQVEKGLEKLSLRGIMRESLPYFWRVLGLYTLFGIGWMAIITLFMSVNVGVSLITFGLGSICLTPLFLLIFPLALVGYSILELAQVAIIADNLKTMDAISKGWQIFRTNILPVVLLMLILYFGLVIISSILVFPMMIPMMFFPMGIDEAGQFNSAFTMIFLVVFLLMMIFMSLVQGILMAFFQTAWVVAYRQLEHDKNTPVFAEAHA